MLHVTIAVLSSLLFAGVTGSAYGTYFIAAPSRIIQGSNYDISVSILNGTDVNVTMSLQEYVYNRTTRKYDVTVLKSQSGLFDNGITGTLSMPVEDDLVCSSCRLHIRGSGGAQFEETMYTYVENKYIVILVQTEKAIYKPGQRVRFRAFAVDRNLQLHKGTFNVNIQDPRNNKIKILENLSSPNNVVEGSLDLGDQPIFGAWTIHVSTGVSPSIQYGATQKFTVEDYDLPRFEVTVELAPYGLLRDQYLTGTIRAKYTFGQPVNGTVELHVGPNRGPNYCGDLPATTQMSFEIDGAAPFKMSISDVRRATSVYSGSEVKVLAYVTESTTGVRLNGSSVIKYYSREYSIEFLENTPRVFKPGVPYKAYLQVTSPDGKPPVGGNRVVKVYTYGQYSFRLPDQSKYSTYQFSGSFPVEGRDYTLPDNGILVCDVAIPTNATYISIKATFEGETASRSASRVSSPSNNFIQLTLLGKFVQANTNVGVKIDSTEPLGSVSYGVIARSVVVTSGTLNCQGQNPCILDLAVTSDMAPTAHLLVYYVRDPAEIVADSLAFNVEGIFKNKVDISFSKNESEPHEDVRIDLQADVNSDVHLLVVDQSVLLLEEGNDITQDRVQDSMSFFNRGLKPTSSEFALSYSSTSVTSMFSNVGFNVLTDLRFSSPTTNYPNSPSSPDHYYGTPEMMGSPASYGSPYTPGSPAGVPSVPSSPGQPTLKEVDRIRKFFPESWLWETLTITSENGTGSILASVPDTITSWVASAFATNPTTGLGVAPTTAKLRVFRPFFISLKYPDRAVRGEQAVVQATIFNYLPNDADVTVTLKGASNFRSVIIAVDNFSDKSENYVTGNQVVKTRVMSNKQGVVYFPIQLTTIGVVNIEITAQTYVAADGVRRQIVVRPEGAPVTFNYPFFIELHANTTNTEFNDNITLVLPPSAVEDSETVLVKVTGDLIGSSLRNIEYLLSLPTGCGEQSMVKTAPNLYVGQYLRATGQLSGSLSERIITNLNYGYQRQLWYQRYDGGFSAFGNTDESSSTWLTAFVIRTFIDVLEFTYVYESMLDRGVDWLVSRQNNDGSFNEFGRVLDRQIQGTGTGPALTAHVLLTLLKTEPIAPKQSCEVTGRCSTVECTQAKVNCLQVYRWGNATSKAVKNLENLVTLNAITDMFDMSVVSYALTLAGSNKASIIFERLRQYAKSEGSFLYWTHHSRLMQGGSSRYYNWIPSRTQYRSIDIITTSYALLTLTAQGRIDDALPVVKWLTSQKNSYGGFSSTQDTVVALHALSDFATRAYGHNTDMTIQVKGEGDALMFGINRDNALSLQIQEMKNGSAELAVSADGSGVAVVEIEHSFYVTDDLTTPSFDVSPVILDSDFNSFNLMICSKWLWNRETGMVVQEVGIPSGFTPDLSTLGDVAGLRRAERKGDIVAVYFDEMGTSTICYSILMTRDDKVARSESSYIKTYDYYEPSDQATTPYLPRHLRDATVCDVCEGCCPDQQSDSSSTTPISPSTTPGSPFTTDSPFVTESPFTKSTSLLTSGFPFTTDVTFTSWSPFTTDVTFSTVSPFITNKDNKKDTKKEKKKKEKKEKKEKEEKKEKREKEEKKEKEEIVNINLSIDV